ncbi:MAG: metallophosphoesterase [Candidatus Omnitrophica bacterium]|nr:metallophosphoesterase [Candidatus Omnitrophota bacterium]
MNKKLFWIPAVVVFLAVFTGIYALYIEPNWLRVRKIDVQLPSEYAAQDGLTVLHLSDFQLRNPQIGWRERRVAALARQLDPDLVVVTGDVIEGYVSYQAWIDYVSALPSRYGVYAVAGNWEHWGDVNIWEMREDLANRGVSLLVNEIARVPVGERGHIEILGLDNRTFQYQPFLAKLLEESDPRLFRLLLVHAPVAFHQAARGGIPLTLAGHTQGGQICLPFVGPLRRAVPGISGYFYGLYREKQSQMYVTSGVGTSTIPIRFFARPEVVLIRLKKD